MSQSYFIWKGVDCRSKGILLEGPVPIIRPEERVQHVTIPGRSGELTLLEDDDTFNSYIQTVSVHVKGAFRVNEVVNWLKGSGYVTFHGQPDMRQKARVIGAVTLDKHSRNLDWWSGTVQFYCEPLKEKLAEADVTITSSGTAVINYGDVKAKPLLKVTSSGTTVVVAAGGNTLTITGATSGIDYYIDCDAQIIWHLESNVTVVDTQLSSGKFPALLPGSNSVTGSGWSQIVITRRERYL
jgi:phage-related protein